MRKNLFIVAIATLVICSCGSSKKTQNFVNVPTGKSSPTGIVASVAEGSQCYALQEEKPALRSVGSATYFTEAGAKQTANGEALAEYATKIQAAVEAACEEVGVSLSQYAGDDDSGKSVSDQSQESGTLTSFVAKQAVQNTTIIKTERYFKSNRQYLVYVCVEYSGDLSDLIKEVEDNLKEKISETDRKRLEERHDTFRKRMESKMSSL